MPEKQGRFQKGKSGNPKGRPPKYASLTSLLKIEVEKIAPQDRKKRTWKELLVLATMKLAMKGHGQALREVWERMDGKVVQTVGTDDGKPLRIVVTYEDAPPPADPKKNS